MVNIVNSREIGTARTYAFIGFIFYIISTVGAFIGLMIFAFLFAVPIMQFPSPMQIPPITTYMTLIILIFFLAFIPGIILTLFAWMTLRAIDAGRYNQAHTYSLILGIIGLFYGLISGIFFLLAYAKLGESMAQTFLSQPIPQRFCVNCGRVVSLGDRFCKHCGKELPP